MSIPYGRAPQRLTLGPASTLLAPPRTGPTAPGASDLRAAFGTFLGQYSQQVVLQRLNLKTHCTHCWSEVNGEGDPLCDYCLGRGYESKFEIHRSRRMSSLNEHRQQLTVQSAPGAELVDEVFWFFDWDVNPQEEDIVYEVTWADAAQTVVDHLLMAFQVTYSVPFRGSNGRIEFWRCSGLGRPIDREIIGRHLRSALAMELNQALKDVVWAPQPLPATPPSTAAAATGYGTSVSGLAFTFVQANPAAVWTINHNLGRMPNITITDSGGDQVVGSYTYPDLNTMVCTFSAPFAGQAYLS